jgi:hypothetical protein
MPDYVLVFTCDLPRRGVWGGLGIELTPYDWRSLVCIAVGKLVTNVINLAENSGRQPYRADLTSPG